MSAAKSVMRLGAQLRRNYERALVAAAEYRRLAAAGDWARADQVERTIDELVGRRTASGTWAWPEPVRRIAHGEKEAR